MQRFQRVTIDIDPIPGSGWQFRAIRAWEYFGRLAEERDVHISSSGEGLHVIGWFRDGLAAHEMIELREHLGDDVNRIEMDIQRLQRGHPVQTLYDSKEKYGDQTKERRFADVYDALDAIEATTGPSDYERVKALANDGHKGEPSLARRLEVRA